VPIQKITKEEILKKSIAVFRQKGYHNTSMQDLAEASGLLKGSLYHYFKSKEDLMKELLVGVNSYANKKAFSIAFDESLTPEERLDKLLRTAGKIVLEQEGGCIIGNTTLETTGIVPVFEPILKSFFDDWTAALQHIFSLKKSPENALRLAQQTVVEMEGAVMMSRLYKDKQFLKDAFVRAMVRIA
jgi:AcrR family transcriptional regulator